MELGNCLGFDLKERIFVSFLVLFSTPNKQWSISYLIAISLYKSLHIHQQKLSTNKQHITISHQAASTVARCLFISSHAQTTSLTLSLLTASTVARDLFISSHA